MVRVNPHSNTPTLRRCSIFTDMPASDRRVMFVFEFPDTPKSGSVELTSREGVDLLCLPSPRVMGTAAGVDGADAVRWTRTVEVTAHHAAP